MTDVKGFFSIDRGAFHCAAKGGLNSAVALLVMARGTGRDNRTTQWSINSIERHTGISRPNAAKAVKDLVDRGIWKKVRDGRHPIYETVPAAEIPGGPSEPFAVAATRSANSFETGATPPVYHSVVSRTGCARPPVGVSPSTDAARTRSWRSADTRR
jgi:hypothetical protein